MVITPLSGLCLSKPFPLQNTGGALRLYQIIRATIPILDEFIANQSYFPILNPRQTPQSLLH